MKKRPVWECGRNRSGGHSRHCRIRQTDSRIMEQREGMARLRELERRRGRQECRIPEQLEGMARLRERKCLRDRRTGRRTKTNKIRMQEGSAVLRESVFPSFIFYSAKDGKNKFVLFSQRFTKRTNLYGMLLKRIGRKGRKSIW